MYVCATIKVTKLKRVNCGDEQRPSMNNVPPHLLNLSHLS
jgi:hypothetical protein